MFHRNPLRGFGAPGGRNLPIPITLAIGFYNSLHYRASRDVTGAILHLQTVTPRMRYGRTNERSTRSRLSYRTVKTLSYHRGTARHAMSVELLSTAAQLYENRI